MTSIASFYFGTKATAPIITPGAAQTATPKIDRLTPGTLKADGSSVDFRAAGSDLADVRGVNVVSGANEIAATNLNATNKALTFKLAIPTASLPAHGT